MPESPSTSVAPEPRREWSLPADPRSVAVIRSGIRDFARRHGVDDDTLGAIALAVSEAVTNSVVHAFVGQDPGTVDAVAETGRDVIVVKVADDGHGMAPRPDSPGLGMGLPLIGQMTASLDIRERSGGTGTEICMTFDAPGVAGSPDREEDPARLAVLEAVTHLTRGGAWPGEGVERLVDLVVPAVADACAIDLLDSEGRPHRLAARAIGAGGEDLSDQVRAHTSSVDLEGSLPHRAFASRETQVAEIDAETLAEMAGRDVSEEIITQLGVHWRVAIPIAEGRVFGLLLLGLRAERGAPDRELLAFFEAIAKRAAEALAKTRLVDELRRLRTRFERILGVLEEAVTVHDAEGRQVYANEAAAKLLGFPSPEAVLQAKPGELAARFIISHEDGSPVSTDEFPGRRLLAGLDAPPLLTRSVEKTSGRARWMVTKASRLDDGDRTLAVNIITDVTEAKDAERRLRFLAEVSERLASSLDYEQTLEGIARLAVPQIADWCAVDVLSPDGSLRRLGLAHVDPDKLALGQELHERYPPALEGDGAVATVLRDGVSVLWEDVPDELLAGGAQDARHLELLRQIGLQSVVIAPLRLRERTIGMISWVNAESGRKFAEADRAFAEDVGRRAAVAVENARLYTELASR